jgi:hypothetical protein
MAHVLISKTKEWVVIKFGTGGMYTIGKRLNLIFAHTRKNKTRTLQKRLLLKIACTKNIYITLYKKWITSRTTLCLTIFSTVNIY